MKDKFKPWQRWVLFALAMAVIFASGVIISFLMEHSAEVVNIDYKKKIKINGIEARSIILLKTIHVNIRRGWIRHRPICTVD